MCGVVSARQPRSHTVGATDAPACLHTRNLGWPGTRSSSRLQSQVTTCKSRLVSGPECLVQTLSGLLGTPRHRHQPSTGYVRHVDAWHLTPCSQHAVPCGLQRFPATQKQACFKPQRTGSEADSRRRHMRLGSTRHHASCADCDSGEAYCSQVTARCRNVAGYAGCFLSEPPTTPSPDHLIGFRSFAAQQMGRKTAKPGPGCLC